MLRTYRFITSWLRTRLWSIIIFVIFVVPSAIASYVYLIERLREISVVTIIAEQHTLLLLLSLMGIQLPWLPVVYWVRKGRSDIRDTYKYKVMVGDQVMHYGISRDLKRSEDRVRNEFPEARAKQVGRRTTREAAERWLFQQK